MRVTLDATRTDSFGTARMSPSTSSPRPLGNDRNTPSAFSGPCARRNALMTLPALCLGVDQAWETARASRAARRRRRECRRAAARRYTSPPPRQTGAGRTPRSTRRPMLAAPGNEHFGRHPQLRRQAEERALEEGLQPRRESEDRRTRKRMQLAIAENERSTRKFGREEPIAEPELVAQRHGGRLLHEQRVGSRIDDELADPFGPDDAARSRSRVRARRPIVCACAVRRPPTARKRRRRRRRRRPIQS